ncbi:hypothetical protein JCM5350_005139 [Sporobolomyces pararoseus]
MSTFSRSTFNAAKYSASRPHYPPQLYTHVLDYATAVNNSSRDHKLSTLLDLGCGPGLSTFEFSPYFVDRIYGIDPSQNMIEAAKSIQATRRQGDREKFRFQVGNVESLTEEIQGIEENSIDLVVAGQAAHWFDPLKTYSSISKILKPGGSFVFWGYGEIFFPQRPELSRLIPPFSRELLGPYWQQPGRSIVENLLKPFPLPITKNFTFPPSSSDADLVESICSQFDQSSLQRSFYLQNPSSSTLLLDDLVPRAEKEPVDTTIKTTLHPLLLTKKWDLKNFENYLNTWSSLHKYREEHQGKGGESPRRIVDDLLVKMRDSGSWRDDGELVEVAWEVGMLMGKKKKK